MRLERDPEEDDVGGAGDGVGVSSLAACVEPSARVAGDSEESAGFVAPRVDLFHGEERCGGRGEGDAESLVAECGEERLRFGERVLEADAVGFVLAAGRVAFWVHGEGLGHLDERC